jgi:dolichol-phosphate mannosyltransferase
MHISIVVPVYNEEQALPGFHQQLRTVIDPLPHSFEILYINDGSTDRTEATVAEILCSDPRVRLVNLSRNFGHQAALTAGLDLAEGDVVISMDGDGQHPPAYIREMLTLHESGFDVVLTRRASEEQVGVLKRFTSRLFYRLINLVSGSDFIAGAPDFRLMSREVVHSFRQIRETHRFLRGLVTWMGYRWTVISIDTAPRVGGSSKYGLRKMARLAYEAIFSFGTLPIRLSILFGFLVLGLAVLQFIDPLLLILSGRQDELVPGWTTLIISVFVLGAIQLIVLAIIGQYVGLIYEEVKRRPLYLQRGETIDSSTLEQEDSQ